MKLNYCPNCGNDFTDRPGIMVKPMPRYNQIIKPAVDSDEITIIQTPTGQHYEKYFLRCTICRTQASIVFEDNIIGIFE